MVASTLQKGTRKKTKRKTNLLRLCTTMGKEAEDAVDKEITRRFKTLIDTSDEDIPKTKIDIVLKQPNSVDINEFDESLQPYIKHYLFMIKRNNRK